MHDLFAAVPAHLLLLGGLLVGALAFLLSRAPGLVRLGHLPLPVLAALGGLGLGAMLWLASPYLLPLVQRTQGLAGPRSCAEARAMGFGTGRRGEPGYFPHLDADGDGYSCEPMPWRR